MVWKLSKLLNFKTKPLSLNYDSLGHEASEITSHSSISGLKYEITKTISPFLQITAVNFKDSVSKSAQYYSTLSFKNSIFQFCFDSNRSYQVKASALTGPVLNRFHTIVSSKKEVYSQFESAYNAMFYNIGLKLIRPTFHASNLVYIINYCQALGSLTLGIEAVGMDNQLGVGISARSESNSSVTFLSLQRFNLITVSYYRRLVNKLELALEAKKSSEFFTAAAGLRMKNYRSEIKFNVDQKLRIGFTWDEKLTENMKIDFNCDYDGEEFNYGIGMTIDG